MTDRQVTLGDGKRLDLQPTGSGWFVRDQGRFLGVVWAKDESWRAWKSEGTLSQSTTKLSRDGAVSWLANHEEEPSSPSSKARSQTRTSSADSTGSSPSSGSS